MDLGLNGKRALVTGSNSGIGAGIAKALAREGAHVIVHGRNERRAEQVAQEIRDAGGTAAIAVGDLDTDAGADAVAEVALRLFGGVDILVNNAGGRVDTKAPVAFFSMETGLWNETYNRNVTSAVRMIQRIVPDMRERKWGRLIQISSYSAQATSGGVAEYAAVKSAVSNLTLGLSKTLADTGITVNTISPGMIHTEALDDWFGGIAKDQGFGDDQDKVVGWVLNNVVKQTVRRLGRPEDIGYTVCFLSSPNAEFINGANFRIDGGASPAVN